MHSRERVYQLPSCAARKLQWRGVTGAIGAVTVTVALAFASASSGQRPSGLPDPSTPGARAAQGRADELRTALAERRGSSEGRRERARSRTRYVDLSDEDALAAAQSTFPQLLNAPAFRWPLPSVGSRIETYLTETTAVVRDTDGTRGVLESTLPLRGDTTDGAKEPADLALVDEGDHFAPKSSFAPVRIPKRAAGEVVFPGRDLGVRLVGGRPQPAKTVSNKVFFANALDGDADLILEPAPYGAEVSLLLRSPASTSAPALSFDLASGDDLRLAGPAAEVVRNGNPIASIAPATAVDAQGQSVDVRYRVDGNRLVLDVDDGGDVAWPVAVDPTIGVYDNNGQSQFGTSPCPAPYSSYKVPCWPGWDYVPQDRYCVFGAPWTLCPRPGNALEVYGYPGTYNPGQSAFFMKYARAGAYIYRFDATNMQHIPDQSNMFAGVCKFFCAAWEQGYWYDYQDGYSPQDYGYAVNFDPLPESGASEVFCVNAPWKADCVPPTYQAGDSNVAMWGLSMYGNPTQVPYTFLGGAATYSADKHSPILSPVTHSNPIPAAGWVKSFSDTVGMHGEDRYYTGTPPTLQPGGLGMGKLAVAGPGAPGAADGCPGGTGSWPPSTVQNKYDACPLTQDASRSYTAPDGVDTYVASATDLVGNRDTGQDQQWTVKVDGTGPIIDTPTGGLWDHRNQAVDHRQEGLYDPSYSVSVHASDGTAGTSDPQKQRSGVKDIRFQLINASNQIVADSPDSQPQLCVQTSCDKTRPWTVNTDSYPDGDYTVKAIATDVAGNSSSKTWPVTIDRRGDIYHATEYDADPTATGNRVGDEWAQFGTQNMRHEDSEAIETRNLTSCLSDPAGCAQNRHRTRNGESTQGAADTYTVETGTSHNDSRMVEESDLLAPANSPLGAPTSTGPLTSALQPWQTAPPAHGVTYELYELATAVDVDGAESSEIHRLWLDGATKLPLRDATWYGSALTSDVYYSYDRGRLSGSEVPTDEFSVPPPTNVAAENDIDLPLVDPPLPPDPLPSDPIAESKLFREQFGLSSDDALVRSVVNDPTLNRGEFGVPLQASELADLQHRIAVQDALSSIEDWGAAHPDVYAGLYADEAHGGLIYVGFTSNAASNLEAVKAVFPYPGELRSFTASRTSATLDSLNDRVADDWDAGTLSQYQLSSVGIDSEQNAVVATSPIATSALEAQLQARYGPGVRLVTRLGADQVANPQTKRVGPLDGGLDIYTFYANEPFECTNAFQAHRNFAAGSGRTYKVFYTLSAGHCNPRHGSAATGFLWSHANGGQGAEVHFGRSAADTTPTNGARARADALAIRIRPRFRANHIFYRAQGDNRDHFRTITSVRHGTRTGLLVCHAGASSGVLHCGTISRYNVGWNHIKPLTEVNFHGRCDVRQGDSGDPVFRGHGAIGTTSAGEYTNCKPDSNGNQTNEWLLYSQIEEDLDGLGYLSLYKG